MSLNQRPPLSLSIVCKKNECLNDADNKRQPKNQKKAKVKKMKVNQMKRKILVLVTTGTLLATSFAAAGCSKRKPAQPAPTQTATVETTETESKVTETEESHGAIETNLIMAEGLLDIETSGTIYETAEKKEAEAKETEAKSTGKKTTKTTKKAKKTKKTAKPSKKPAKKPAKPTTKPAEKTDATKESQPEIKASDVGEPATAPTEDKTANVLKKTNKVYFKYGVNEYKDDKYTATVIVQENNTIGVRIRVNSTTYLCMSGKIDPETNTFKYSEMSQEVMVSVARGTKLENRTLKRSGEIKFVKNGFKWTDSVEHSEDSIFKPY